MRRQIIMVLIAGLAGMAPVFAADISPKPRYHSPSGRYELVFQTLPDDWTHHHNAIAGAAKETMDQYAIMLYPKGASEPVNAIYYADLPPAPSPEALIQTMVWSPGERYVALPDKQKAREENHVFYLVAPLADQKVWNLQVDHLHWIDDRHFVGDLNTKEVPGGIMRFDTQKAKAELLIPADNGIGYQIAAVHDHRLTVKGFVNNAGDGKTTWEAFIPSCFDLDLDTLKKRSVPCP